MDTASQSRSIAVLNGPNLNLLGSRQPEIYGRTTLAEIEAACRSHGAALGFGIDFAQSNSEGALVELVQQHAAAAAIIINAAGYTHTSVALLDALLNAGGPVIEVHLSHPQAREPFRHHSVIAPACRGVIAGFGPLSYRLALDAAAALVDASNVEGEG